MKKWVSLFLGASLALVTPVSAFATGLHEKSDGHEHGKFTWDGQVKVASENKGEWKDKWEHKVKADAKIKVKANADGDHQGDDNGDHEGDDNGDHEGNDNGGQNGGNDGQDGNMHANVKIKLDGVIDTAWKNAERIVFKDAATGLDGYCRFMWDEDNLYMLVELQGAAKLWKESNKPVLFSLWYNGDEEVKGGKAKEDGFVAVTWPDMTVRHDNGLHLGWFKPDKLVKAFATNGDNVNLELKLPWVNNNGIKLSDNTELGLCIKLKELGAVAPDVNGKMMINLTEQQIKDLKGELTVLPLQLVASLVAGASDNADTGNGSGSGNAGGTGTAGGTAGTTTPGSNTSAVAGTDNRTGATITLPPVTAVKGVSDTAGVIPSGMPQTGGGGASEWTD